MRSLFLMLTMCLPVLPATAKYSGGSGTADDPYQIATAADLIALGETPEDYDKHFVLTADIDLDPNLPGRKVFDRAVVAADANDTEDGFQGTAFSGVFEGNGHRISHLTIRGEDFVGLFGLLGWWDAPGGEVKNLGMVDAHTVGSGRSVGALAAYNCGSMSRCYNTGAVNGGSHVGGLVGVNGGTIADCYSTGAVSGEGPIGGLVGNNGGTIADCYNTGAVSGEGFIGGLVGHNYGTMADCYSTGAISGIGSYVGGLVGLNELSGAVTNCYSTGGVSSTDFNGFVGGLVGDNRGDVAHCYNAGAVSGNRCVGGLVGWNDHGSVTDCCSTGVVSGNSEVGGLVAVNGGAVTHCYSTGMVTGDEYVGGLIGDNYYGWMTNCYSSGLVSGTGWAVGGLVGVGSAESAYNCFWDAQTSGQMTSAGGVGKTTTEMQTASTFLESGWDFVDETANGTEDIWWILEGKDYPRLWWELLDNR